MKVTPELWAESCRPIDGAPRCNRCALCRYEISLAVQAHAAPWTDPPDDKQPMRGVVWPDVDEALDFWWVVRATGAGASSALGKMLDRVRDGLTGGKAGTSFRGRVDDTQQMLAVLASVVERALHAACEMENPWSLGADTIMRIAVARTVGEPRREKHRGKPVLVCERVAWDVVAEREGISERQVHGVVKRVRRSLIVQLSARGLVPLPGRNSGLRWDALSLREQLLTVRRDPSGQDDREAGAAGR